MVATSTVIFATSVRRRIVTHPQRRPGVPRTPQDGGGVKDYRDI
jgi:hypothetical protein